MIEQARTCALAGDALALPSAVSFDNVKPLRPQRTSSERLRSGPEGSAAARFHPQLLQPAQAGCVDLHGGPLEALQSPLQIVRFGNLADSR